MKKCKFLSQFLGLNINYNCTLKLIFSTYRRKAKLLRNKFLLTITLVLNYLLIARQFKNMTKNGFLFNLNGYHGNIHVNIWSIYY